jgi:hypothetical protein
MTKKNNKKPTTDSSSATTTFQSSDPLRSLARNSFKNETWELDRYIVCYSFVSDMKVQSFQYLEGSFSGDIGRILNELIQTQTLLVHRYPQPCESYNKNDIRLPLLITYDQHMDNLGKFEWKHKTIKKSSWTDFVNAVWEMQCTAAEETVEHTKLIQNMYSTFNTIYQNSGMQLDIPAVLPNTKLVSKKVLYIRNLKPSVTTSDVRDLCGKYGPVTSVEYIRQQPDEHGLGVHTNHTIVTFERASDANTTKNKLHRSTSDLSERSYATSNHLLVEFADVNLTDGMEDLLKFAPEPNNVELFVEKEFRTGYQGGFRYFVVVKNKQKVYCFTAYNEAR